MVEASGHEAKSGDVAPDARVLVVSPEAAGRLLLTQMLERAGRPSSAVATGAEAIDALGRAAAALVLVDATTPDLDALLGAATARALPVLLMGATDTLERRATAVLPKPVRQTALATAVAQALGAIPAIAPRRTLLVDDDPVSGELAAQRLERLGWTVVRARSASEAWVRWRSEPVDLVLLDVLLPDLAGPELTAHIRAHEHAAGARRVAIVALTGRASEDDRERCVAAGMDGHLTKPLDVDALARVLAGLAGDVAAAPPATCVAPADEPLDAERLLAQVHGDMAFLRRLIALFCQQSEDLLRAGWLAIERRDSQGLDGAAHALRSVLGHFSTGAAFELAGTVEAMARSAEVAAASAPWQELEGRVADLRRALGAIDQDGPCGRSVP